MQTINIDHPDVTSIERYGYPANVLAAADVLDEQAANEANQARYTKSILEDGHWLVSVVETLGDNADRTERVLSRLTAHLQALHNGGTVDAKAMRESLATTIGILTVLRPAMVEAKDAVSDANRC